MAKDKKISFPVGLKQSLQESSLARQHESTDNQASERSNIEELKRSDLQESKSLDSQDPRRLDVQTSGSLDAQESEGLDTQDVKRPDVQTPRVRHTIYLPADLSKKLKYRAVETDDEMSVIVENALRDYFDALEDTNNE